MARRTTPSLVREVLDPDFDPDFSLEAFIDTASVLVDRVEESPLIGSVNSQHLEIIERWLAAHFADITYKSTKTSESIGAASRSWSIPQLSNGFEGTVYGQQALNLDITGTLKRITGEPVTMHWLGTEEE